MTDPMVPKYVAVLIVAFVFVVLVAVWAVHPPDAEYRERMLRLAVTGHSSRIGARVGAAISLLILIAGIVLTILERGR